LLRRSAPRNDILGIAARKAFSLYEYGIMNQFDSSKNLESPMPAKVNTQIENAFLTLPPLEREAIITHGAAIRLSALKQRLFLAQSNASHKQNLIYKCSDVVGELI
jgi:hypothetical protein